MRKRLRAQIELLLLPSKNEVKAMNAKAAGTSAGPAAGPSTADGEARKALKLEKLAAMGLGPAASKGAGGKRKASKEVASGDGKKQKGTDGKSAAASADAADDPAKKTDGKSADAANAAEAADGMDVSDPTDGEQTKKPFNKVVKVSHLADKNPFTLSVHRYTETKDGKKSFCQMSKDEWTKGLFERISAYCDDVHIKAIQDEARGVKDTWSPKILHNYHEDGHGVIIPGDEKTCVWLTQEILPQIQFKLTKLSARLRTPKVLDQSKKTMMVRFTINLPTGTRSNGKDTWWQLFCYRNGLSSGTKFHESVTIKATGQTKLAFYCTEDRAAFLWYADPHNQTGYRRPKTVVINGGGAYVPLYCGGLNLRATKEVTWEGIINSLVPIPFEEEGGNDGE